MRLQCGADRGVPPHPLPGEYRLSSTLQHFSFTIAFLISPFHTFELHHKPFTLETRTFMTCEGKDQKILEIFVWTT